MTLDLTDRGTLRSAAGAVAWRPADLPADRYTYELTRSDVDELDAALRAASSRNLLPSQIEREDFPLSGLAARLRTIEAQLAAGIGLAQIRGVPVARYSSAEAELLLCGIGTHLGRRLLQNAQGDVINHVRDASGESSDAARARGYRSRSELPFHSDSCDIGGLLCLRDAKAGGLSAIASSHAIHDALLAERPDLLHTLYQPFHIDRHGDGPPGAPPYYATPVFMWHGDRLFSRFNPGYVFAAQRYPETPRLTERQVAAIAAFAALCASDAFRLDMTLQPGDLQLLNNNVTVHARSAYEDHVEPARKRHLLRLWLCTSDIDDIPVPMRDRQRDMEAWRDQASR